MGRDRLFRDAPQPGPHGHLADGAGPEPPPRSTQPHIPPFTLEALGRYREVAAEWRHVIGWLEAHDMAVHTTWPKEMLAGIEAKLAAADTHADDPGR